MDYLRLSHGHILTACVFFGLISLVSGYRCPSYCDEDGYYINSFYCYSPRAFCCGDHVTRFCCTNSTQDVSTIYPDVFMCPNSSWWLFHWQVALGMLGGVILLLLVAACCCKVCVKNDPSRRRRRSTRRSTSRRQRCANEVAVSTILSEPAHTNQAFDPTSAFAFEPPPYDSITGAPPKYVDVFGEGYDSTNLAFVSDSTSLPPYSLRETTSPAAGTSGGHQPVTSSGEQQRLEEPKEDDTRIIIASVSLACDAVESGSSDNEPNGEGHSQNSEHSPSSENNKADENV